MIITNSIPKMKHKTSLTILLAAFCLIAFNSSQAQIRTPIASPSGSVSGDVGLTTITVDYFRPGVKGRKVFGDGGMEAYGNIWRTGANSGSKITFSTDVKFGGKEVKAGEYLIFTIPNKDEWTAMLYSDINLGGNVNGYDEANEVARIQVKPEMLSKSVERLTFTIADISEDNTKANIRLEWADVAINLPIEVNFDEAVMKDIAAKTRVNPSNYIAAASYYFNTGKDLNKALEWIDMYFASGDNKGQFWNVHLKAQILAKMGKTKEAIATAEESMATAKASANGDFGYIKRNEDLIASLKKK